MKKGLILALTMVALVAMALPVGAIAPVIEDLPSVIIGDTGDVSTDAVAKHLYRYTNIMNIANSNKITWGNVELGFGDAQKHAYYMTDDTAIKAYTATSEVAPIDANAYAAIEDNGTKPATGTEITGSNFFWLSLANNLSGTQNVYSATAAANGVTTTPSTDPAMVTLVLADGDFPTTAVAQSQFSVYTVSGSDDGFSGTAVKVYDADFAAGANGWVYTGAKGTAGLADAVNAAANGQLTLKNGAASSSIYFGTWNSGKTGVSGASSIVPVDAATQAGNIFRGTFTLTSDATSAANTPGYRIFYETEAFTHLGGISHNSGEANVGAASIYAPSSAGAKDVVVYWAAPLTLTEYGDTGKLATVQAGKDFRDYIIAFDMIGYDKASDSGTLGLDNVLIEMIERPAAGTSLVNWGTGGGSPFNSPLTTAGWAVNTTDAATGLGRGTATVNADTITFAATTASTGYQAIGPFASATSLPAWTSGKLIRANVKLASSNVNASPVFRVLTLSVKNDGNSRSIVWVDSFNGDVAKGLWSPTGNTASSSPAAGAGSALELYVYTHTAPTGADAGVLEPQIDCYTTGPVTYTGNNTVWPAETATLTLSKFQYEECPTQ